MKKVKNILKKFFIIRYIKGVLIAYKYIIINKKFIKPKYISIIYLIFNFAYYYAKDEIEIDEYFNIYEFYKLRKVEKNKYMTRKKFAKITRELSKDIRDVFWNKEKFLKEFSPFIKRKWIDFDDVEDKEIKSFINNCDKIIIKPKAGSLGKGIGIINTKEIKNISKFIKKYKNSSMIAEEVIVGNKELQEFHPNSLNTIRVVTFYNGKNFIPFNAFFRMGNNDSCIDNLHSGGISGIIDVNSGIVVTKGRTTNGQKYIFHPYSNKQILGFKIPMWDEILKVCEQASKQIPNIKIAGWDIAINDNNEIIIVEANHMPDMDAMQLEKGLNEETKKILNEMYKIKI